MAIGAAGAAIPSLIVHAHDPSTPPETAWLVGGAVALGLVALVPTALSLEDARRLPDVYRKVASTMVLGSAAALLVAWLAPTPWVLTLLLAAILTVVWVVAIGRFLRAGAWSEVEDVTNHDTPAPATG